MYYLVTKWDAPLALHSNRLSSYQFKLNRQQSVIMGALNLGDHIVNRKRDISKVLAQLAMIIRSFHYHD